MSDILLENISWKVGMEEVNLQFSIRYRAAAPLSLKCSITLKLKEVEVLSFFFLFRVCFSSFNSKYFQFKIFVILNTFDGEKQFAILPNRRIILRIHFFLTFSPRLSINLVSINTLTKWTLHQNYFTFFISNTL